MTPDLDSTPPPGPTRRGIALLVQNVDALGGSERQATLLADALTRAGERVCLITTAGFGPGGRPTGPWRRLEGRVEVWRLPLAGFEASATLIALRAGCDLLYAVGIMMGSFAVRIGRVLRAPVVVKLAGMGHAGDISTFSGLPPGPRERLRAELASAVLVCVAEAVEDEARGVGFHRLVRIPNGVLLPPPSEPSPASTPNALYLGRLQEAKGVDLLVEAWQEVEGALLLVAGEGPQGAALRARVAELGLEERVRFLGRRDDVPDLLREARLMVLPSRSEGLSNALLEALAAGVPVVASGIPPNLEVLSEAGAEDAAGAAVARGEQPWAELTAGVAVTPLDPGALAAGLRAVWEDAALRRRLSRAGPARVAARYGIEAVATRYRALFASLEHQGPGLRLPLRFVQARGTSLARALRGAVERRTSSTTP